MTLSSLNGLNRSFEPQVHNVGLRIGAVSGRVEQHLVVPVHESGGLNSLKLAAASSFISGSCTLTITRTTTTSVRIISHDPGTLGLALRLHACAVWQKASPPTTLRAGQPPGSRGSHPLLRRRVIAGRDHRRGRRRQDRRLARCNQPVGPGGITSCTWPNPSIGTRGRCSIIVRAHGAAPRGASICELQTAHVRVGSYLKGCAPVPANWVIRSPDSGGSMFGLRRKRFIGSYFPFRAASRS
jgi:hypothetical protein